MFATCDNKGFQMQFSNGYRVSCQFGTMNYCSRRDWKLSPARIFEEKKMDIVESKDCELAIIKDMEFVTGRVLHDFGMKISAEGTSVVGWVTADEVANIIAYVSKLEA